MLFLVQNIAHTKWLKVLCSQHCTIRIDMAFYACIDNMIDNMVWRVYDE